MKFKLALPFYLPFLLGILVHGQRAVLFYPAMRAE